MLTKINVEISDFILYFKLRDSNCPRSGFPPLRDVLQENVIIYLSYSPPVPTWCRQSDWACQSAASTVTCRAESGYCSGRESSSPSSAGARRIIWSCFYYYYYLLLWWKRQQQKQQDDTVCDTVMIGLRVYAPPRSID